MKLSKELISKIIGWYEEYEDSNNPNDISAEQYISNKLSWENPIDEDKLDELAMDYVDKIEISLEFNRTYSLYNSDKMEESYKAGYRKAMEE